MTFLAAAFDWSVLHFWSVVGAIELVWVILLVGGILLERRSPVATLAWIMSLVWLPAVGLVVYYFFGPRRLRRKKLKRQEASRLLQRSIAALAEHDDDVSRTQLAQLAVSAGEAPPLPIDSFELIVDGDAYYDALEKLILSAEHHVHLEYYIYDDDRAGRRVRDLLVERAKAGVEVRLLIDAIGAYLTPDSLFTPLLEAGGKFARFNPVRFGVMTPRLANFRTHRKLVVVDGVRAMLGGMNISECHAPMYSGAKAWRDTQLCIEGSAVRSLQRIFLEDWLYASSEVLPSSASYLPDVKRSHDGSIAQIVGSGPDHDLYAIYQLFFAAISSAKQRVWISTPYFVPDDPMLVALISAGLRKVDVVILIPEQSDNRVVDFAARSYFADLLRAGVKIHTYRPSMLHAKTIVVDDDLSLIGTANMDNRSFRLNFELMAAVYDHTLNHQLADAFERDLARAEPVTTREVRHERLPVRLAESVSRLLGPLL